MSLRKAVICGIDEYPAPNKLPSCVNDARAIARMVAGEPTAATPSTSCSTATRRSRASSRSWRWMAADLRPEDRVLCDPTGDGFT